MPAVAFDHVDVLFGGRSAAALAMLDRGVPREKVIAATDCVPAAVDINLAVETGEICVIMGLSGSGKSTVLRAVNRLTAIARGAVTVEHEGRAIDVFFRPVNDANRTRGWALAHYLVGNAARLDIRTVIFDDRIWTAGRNGWRDYDPPDRAGSREILEHRDHVHVDVFA